MLKKNRLRVLLMAIIVSLCVSIGFVAAAPPAQAAGGYVQVFNFGGPRNTGVGIVNYWTSPNTYQYVLGSQRWTPTMNAKGAYIGSWYCGDIYYSWDQGRTWKYQWSARGPQFVSFPGWSISWVGVYPYPC